MAHFQSLKRAYNQQKKQWGLLHVFKQCGSYNRLLLLGTKGNSTMSAHCVSAGWASLRLHKHHRRFFVASVIKKKKKL